MKLATKGFMNRSLVNFIYWFLMKSVEKYYGDSLTELEDGPYPYVWNIRIFAD